MQPNHAYLRFLAPHDAAELSKRLRESADKAKDSMWRLSSQGTYLNEKADGYVLLTREESYGFADLIDAILADNEV